MKDLNTLKFTELREMAKKLHVRSWWDLKKSDLIVAIEDALNNPEETQAQKRTNTLSVEQSAPEAKETTQKKNQKRLIEYNGKTQTLTAWARELGIRHQTLYNRIVMKGMDVEKAFAKPTKGDES